MFGGESLSVVVVVIAREMSEAHLVADTCHSQINDDSKNLMSGTGIEVLLRVLKLLGWF